MRLPNKLSDRLADTSLAEPLRALDRIYARIEAEQTEWIAATPFRCPFGCGSCCAEFEPEILDVEALYLAAWWLSAHPDRPPAPATSAGRGCALSDPDGEYHCTAYGGRPLVCRLFAYSGDRDKLGRARFRLCAKMPGDVRDYGAEALVDRFGRLPPVMGDLAGEADALLPGRSGQRRPLRDALPAAIAKIRQLMDFAASSAFAAAIEATARYDDHDGDNDSPGGAPPPLPAAV
jgi:Fe-S-cluster containining protein